MSDLFRPYLSRFFGKHCSIPQSWSLGSRAVRRFYVFDAQKEKKAIRRLIATYIGTPRDLASAVGVAPRDVVLFGVAVNDPDEPRGGLDGVLDTLPQLDGVLLYEQKNGVVYFYDEGSVLPLGGRARPLTVNKLAIAREEQPASATLSADVSRPRADRSYQLRIGAAVRSKKASSSGTRFGGGAGIDASRWPTLHDKPLVPLFQLATGELLQKHAGIAVFVSEEGLSEVVPLLLNDRELLAKPRPIAGSYKEYELKVTPRAQKASSSDSTLGGKPVPAPRGFRFLAQFNFSRDMMQVDIGEHEPIFGLLQLFVGHDETVVKVVWREGSRVSGSADHRAAGCTQ